MASCLVSWPKSDQIFSNVCVGSLLIGEAGQLVYFRHGSFQFHMQSGKLDCVAQKSPSNAGPALSLPLCRRLHAEVAGWLPEVQGR